MTYFLAHAFHLGITLGLVVVVCAHTYCVVRLWRERKRRWMEFVPCKSTWETPDVTNAPTVWEFPESPENKLP